jgi:murein DD-endopeptidase MepM/ murein hydrolase activator NlpD
VLLRPLGGILMIHNAWIGIPLWLVVAADLHRGTFAFLGLLLGEAARLTLGLEHRAGSDGSLKTNAVLTALAVAWLLPAEGLSLTVAVILTALATAIAAVVTAALARALEGTELSPLVWGYSIVAGILFIIFPDWALNSALATDWGTLPSGAGGWIEAFFRTLGAFLFAPTATAGAVIAAAILAWSRAMFIAGLIGWLSGILTALVLVDLGVPFYWLPSAYNFFLAGMALGSVYFLPGWSGLAAAAGAGIVAAFLAVGLQHLLDFSSASFLPIPLCLTVWVGMGALQSVAKRGHIRRNRLGDIPPEDAWRQAEVDRERWGQHETLLMVPLNGEVEITQGFSGAITHVGRWRHALDFQRPRRMDAVGRDRASIFGAPVLAPAPGTVARVRNDVPDNPPGRSNYARNWGNYVVIGLDAGGWALLAHLKQGSVTVPVGARVDYGTVVGAVGNSGRSPELHLHLQVQEGPEPGAATLPFRLANYLYAERPGDRLANWAAAAVPSQETILKAATADTEVHRILAGMSTGRAHWSVEMRGDVPPAFRPASDTASLRVDISLDSDGRQVIEPLDGGRLIARFDPDAWRVVEIDAASSAFLRILGLAMPSVPYATAQGVQWSDIAMQARGRTMGWLGQSLLPFRTAPFVKLELRCTADASNSHGSIAIETRPVNPDRHLPRKIVCELRDAQGPASIVAEFAEGALIYSLYSFVAVPPQSSENRVA